MHFKRFLLQAGTGSGGNVFDGSAFFEHDFDRVFNDTGKRTPPAGMSGADNAVFFIGQQNRHAVGGGNAQNDAGTVGDHAVGLDFVTRGAVDINGFVGMPLAGTHHRVAGEAVEPADQFKVFFYVFRLVAAFAVEVETGVNALGNAAVPAEKGMPVRRQVGCEVKIDHIFKHCFIPRFRLRPD